MTAAEVENSDSNDVDVFKSDYDGIEILKNLVPTEIDSESEVSESNDESKSESENDEMSTDKEKCSKLHSPFIEYFVNQAWIG